jgi:hypothetical protein
MAIVQLNGAVITDSDSFHTECQQAFGFPEFYGRNMDAWVDCLSYLRDDEGMSKFRLKPDEILQIEVLQADTLHKQAPHILEEMEFCIIGINERYVDYGEKPALSLVLRS